MAADGLHTTLLWQSSGPIPFQRLFKAIPFVVTFEDDSIADNAVYDGGGTVAVVGAKLGDFVLIGAELDLDDLHMFATVTAADVVTIISSNNGATDPETQLLTGVKINGLVLSLKNEFWDSGDLT